MIENNLKIKDSKVLVMGLTFKENCPDLRNSKVADMVQELKDYGVEVLVVDPMADAKEAMKEYGIVLYKIEDIKDVDTIVVAVGHKEYRALQPKDFKEYFSVQYQNHY